jgi:NADH-quinone oxidoreductase subunit F
VADAIAAGKKAAAVIDRYLLGKGLRMPPQTKLPKFFLEPAAVGDEEFEGAARVEPATLPAESRKKNFAEVETAFSAEAAKREARRCLRCDLEFTRPEQNGQAQCAAVEEQSA